MGYEYQPPTYKLTFDDHPGLEIMARAVELGDYIDFVDLLDTAGFAKQSIDKLFTLWVGFLTSWNLQRNGKNVPLTVKSLYKLDLKFVQNIIDGWRRGMEGIDAPLDESSNAGQPSVAASIPMESLSESHAS